MSANKYEELAAIDVSKKIEKKNGLSYLSWAWAVDALFRHDPEASWDYTEPKMYGDTMMIFCTVKAFGRSRTAQLPVMDHRNKAIANPDAFQVNTAMQRALVKAIALHGLGLYIYAGEDLPEGEGKPVPVSAKSQSMADWDELKPAQQAELQNLADCVMAEFDQRGADAALVLLRENTGGEDWDATLKSALNSRFDPKIRRALKEAGQPRKAA